MASTADCKTLLETSPEVGHPGPFKRLSKKNADDGVERIFASNDGTKFVRMLEDANGALSIDRVGASLEEVAPGATAPAVKKASAKPAPSGPLHVIDPDQDAQAKLSAAIAAWAQDPYEVDTQALTALCEQHPVAALNQFVFAVCLSPDDEVSVEVMPRVFWEQNKHCCDFPSVIEGILPGDEVESPNESSTFFLFGFEDEKDQAAALLAAGVEWRADLQAFINDMNDVPKSDANKFNKWMQSADLQKRLGGPVSTPPALVDIASTQADLDALVALSTAPRVGLLSAMSGGQRRPKDDPPNVIALIPCPDPANPTPHTQTILDEISRTAPQARAYETKFVLVPVGSEAFNAIQSKLPGTALAEWDVVGLHEGAFATPGRQDIALDRVVTLYLGGLQAGLSEMRRAQSTSRRLGM